MDNNELTEFMNQHTFSESEINHYPYKLRHTYIAAWEDGEESLEFYAIDDIAAIEYLNRHYTRLPDSLSEKITTYREVKVS
jgi:hypothetical protein